MADGGTVPDVVDPRIGDRGTTYKVAGGPGPAGGSMPAPVPAPAPAKRPALPAPCVPESLENNDAVKRDAGQILQASDSMNALYEEVRTRVKILRGELAGGEPGELGKTGRLADQPDKRDLVVISLAWSKIATRFRLASVLSHEYRHAKQALDRGCVAPEAAPFLKNAGQYLVLRWWSEFDAFDFQQRVLAEIARNKPEYQPCVAAILADDQRLSLLAKGATTEAMATIAADYPAAALSAQYLGYRGISKKEIEALADVSVRVEAMLKSPLWAAQQERWAAFARKEP